MRAFVVREYAHPSKISLSLDAPEPKPDGPDDVIVDIYSAGLNFFDILQAQGKYQIQPPFPFTLGSEFAGKIAPDSPIPRECLYKHGDRVFGYAQGAYGDRVVTDYRNVLPLPQNLTFDQGAGLSITWPTSYEGLVGRAQLKPGEWVLVTASAGGVGMAAVQIGKSIGANVIAATSSDAKLAISKRYGGADFVVDYSKPGWQQEVLKITNGNGVDVIFDPVGLIRDSLKCIAWKGRAVVVGFAGGEIEQLPLNLVLLKNISIVGILWGSYNSKGKNEVPKIWEGILQLFSSGKAIPVVFPDVFPLERLADGLGALENRKTWGKAIVRVKEEYQRRMAKL